MATDLESIQQLLRIEEEITKLNHLQEKTNGLWAGLTTNTEELETALRFKTSLLKSMGKLATTVESLSNIGAPLGRLLGEGIALLEPAGPVTTAGKTYRESLGRYKAAMESLATVSGTPLVEIEKAKGELPEILAEQCRGIIQFEPKLRDWGAWRKVRGEAITYGLAPLVTAVENGTVRLGNLKETFKTDYARWWLDNVVDDDEVLRTFGSAIHEKRIEDFRDLDDHFTDLTRDYIRSGLCSNLPNQEDTTRNSEWGLLRREMQKKRRHMPLREMMNQIPTAITKLAPCLMMSPLSIAQYLSPDTALFDVVVFDEASQIPPWDAIGAIARGKQVVMVGDQMQLPPTSFFDRAEADGDEDSDIESDLESILDECIGANLPKMNLTWHYRSRHESLIAFSNNRYYGGSLVTFPSPITEDRAVSYQFVQEGIYEKGGARINKPEAKALVDHIVSRLNDPEFEKSKLTIGIVTFNSEQQHLIEDLLDDERRKSPSIEPYFAEDISEPIFVKNLESVQGDERDIMYFSTTYGPDLTGSVSMNFGPMNRDGGERRLNVAITRARHELRVFSSLRPEQMDLSRTQAIGVRDLKHFLEFAERGPKAIAEAVHGPIGDFDSPFEKEVADALTNKGWQIHPQVGVSKFRIDLGVVDPDAPGQYLAGVECDGATYHRSATARDRDKLREQILRGLNWEILRVWSTDWWIDAGGALEKVHTKLESILEKSRKQREEQEQKARDNIVDTVVEEFNEPEEDAIKTTENIHQEVIQEGRLFPKDEKAEPTPYYAESGSSVVLSDEGTGKTVSFHPIGASKGDLQTSAERGDIVTAIPSNPIFASYQAYSGQSFPDPRNASHGEIADGLCQIIEVEGPILVKRAYDIYLRGCGIKRMGAGLKSLMNKAFQKAVQQGLVIVEDELNRKGFIKAYVRTKGTPPIQLRERGPRTLEEIPPSEILVASHITLEKGLFQEGSDEHLHAILGLFNLKRLTTSTGSMLLEILDLSIIHVGEWLNTNPD